MREQSNRKANSEPLGSNPIVSVVIPVHNEESQIEQCLQSAYLGFGLKPEVQVVGESENLEFTSSQVEFIVVDAASTDRTPVLLNKLSKDAATDRILVSHLRSPRAGRAQQMNYGAQKASGKLLVFLHADTRLQGGFGAELKRFLNREKDWGFCRVSLDTSGWQFAMLRFMINLRSRLFSISTGDQTQFCKSDVFNLVGGFPDQPLMEDIEISKLLKDKSAPCVLKAVVITSSRKWQKEGFWNTVFLMWKLRFSYWRGATAQSIHQRYYRSN